MLYQHEDTKIAVRLLANDVHIQEHFVTASPTGIHDEQKWTSMVPITVGQTLALEYRIIGLDKVSVMVDVKIDGVWRLRKMYGPSQTVRELVDAVIMKEKHALYYAKMCAKDQSAPDPDGSDDEGDDGFAPVKGSAAFEVGNIELLFFTSRPQTSGRTDYSYRKGPYFENDPERGFTQRAAADTKLTSKVYQEAGPATCNIELLKGSRLSEKEEATATFEAKRPLLSSVPFVSFKFLYRDQRVLSYECDQPSQDITSAGVSSGFWAITPSLSQQQVPQRSQQPQRHVDQSQQPRQREDRGNKKKKHKKGQVPFTAGTDIGAGTGQIARALTVTYPPIVTFAPNATYPSSVRNPPPFERERHTSNNIPSAPELITPSSPVADTGRNSLDANTLRGSWLGADTVRKSSLAKPHQGSNRRNVKTVRFAPISANIFYEDESNVITPESSTDDKGQDFSDDKFGRCLSKIGDRSATPSRRLRIDNLGPGTTQQDLRDLFKDFVIRNVEIPILLSTQLPATFGYVIINTQDEADRAAKELTGKMIQSRPVTVNTLAKPKSTEADKGREAVNKPQTEIEAPMVAEAVIGDSAPGILESIESDPPIAHRRRFPSPPALAESDAIGVQESAPLTEFLSATTQNEFLRFFETKKRKLDEIDELRDTLAAELADMGRMAKRFKIVLDRSAETSSNTDSQGHVGSRETEGSTVSVDAAETEAAISTNTTYSPHESSLRALSERLGRIDELKSRQEDGESLETSELLEIKMEEQVRLELTREIKSSPGLEPRAMEDVDQDLPLLDAPSADQADGTRDAGASSVITGTENAESADNKPTAAGPDLKTEDPGSGEREDLNANKTGANRAEKTKVYIKLEDDDD